jgi:DnaJ-domain-containing protein 1
LVATGSISDRPLGRTVAAVAQRHFTGELRIGAGAGGVVVGWEDGAIVAAHGSHAADSAVKTALGAGLITSTQAAEILRQLTPGADEVAVVAGHGRLAPEQATRLRRRVVANRAMRIFAVEAGFELHDTSSLPVAADMVPIDPRVIVYQGARAHFDEARFHRELGSVGESFQLDAAAGVPEGFGFGEPELALIELLSSAAYTPVALVQAAPQTEPRTVLGTLYALASFGYLEAIARARPAPVTPVEARPRTPTPPSRSPRGSATPARRAPAADADAIRALVAERRALVDARADHYAILGVSPDTPPDRIRAAYFEVARQLHPDRIVATGLDEIRGEAQRVFARINAAFGVLSHPKKRAEYQKTLAAGGEEAVRRRAEEADALARRIFEAEEHFRAGEMALRRNQLEVAIRAFGKAVELNPDECEHHALLAWATWCAASDKAVAGKTARADLEKASQISPRNPTPHLYLGKIARSLGDDEAAARHLKRCLEVSPGHGEASSELRIVEMRLKQAAAPEDKKPGLFGRFKRD